ncbi:MAG: glycosyltransferase family 2 protein [Chitinophagaceae bacterium]
MSEKLSILISCFNEELLVAIILRKILEVQLDYGMSKEIIIVDDGSTDNTSSVIQRFIEQNKEAPIIFIQHKINKGKGAGIHSALQHSTGNIVIIQDADLEYDPKEYSKLLKPIMDGHADVVYGSRFRGSEAHRILFFFHSAGNQLLTFFSNVFTGLNLTDMETGYKMFRKEILQQITIREKRFGIEPEITARISRIKDIRIYEVGISYYGRSYAEGKKINWKDGFRAMYCILKYNIFSRT